MPSLAGQALFLQRATAMDRMTTRRNEAVAPGAGAMAEGELSAPERIRVRSGTFAVVGDLQPTSSLEVWRESNPRERKAILREVAEENPDFVAFLGDLVFCGSSASAWDDFDSLSGPLRSAGIPAYPVLGNHEYWLTRRPALTNFFGRFPHLRRRHWYALVYGDVGLVFLDSNVHWLPAAAWREQLDWYRRTLARWDDDEAIRGVIVILHHPPFTNSRVTSDTIHVQRDFVPAFSTSAKTLAMISGHVHNYERFVREGKTFLVAGGGGGPRAALFEGKRRRHSDDLFEGGRIRAFHYLRFRPQEAALVVEVRGLEKDGTGFDTMERFELGWAATL
jgi:3',5'-cyclic AMP phosphodiesterase CpdA